MSDLVKQEWPREIWMAELGENHNGTGMVVLSEFATVPRWEGDDERDCDFQRYVDADILESSERYHKHMLATQAERIERLEASQEELAGALREIAEGYGPNHLSKFARDIALSAIAKIAPRPHQQAVTLDELTDAEREELAGLMDAEIDKMEANLKAMLEKEDGDGKA